MGTTSAYLHLMDEVTRLQQENNVLKMELRASNCITTGMLETMNMKTQQLAQTLQNNEEKNNEEKKYLFQRIKILKRRVCSEDCLCCSIVHICENNQLGIGIKICCPQLRTIFIWSAFHEHVKIAPEDLKCAQFMEILKKCKVVETSSDDVYEYLPQMVGRENEMGKAFDKLMTINPTSPVVIIGRLFSKSTRKGHAELCYLNSRTHEDGNVTIHDPQENTATEMGRQDFVTHVKKDEGVEFYTVNLDLLKTILNYFGPILHVDKPPENTLAVPTVVDGR